MIHNFEDSTLKLSEFRIFLSIEINVLFFFSSYFFHTSNTTRKVTLTNVIRSFSIFLSVSLHKIMMIKKRKNSNETRETVLMQFVQLNNVDCIRFTSKINSSTIVVCR